MLMFHERGLILCLFQLCSENLEALKSPVLLFTESFVYVLLPDLLFELELELDDFHLGPNEAFMVEHRSLKNNKVIRIC